MQPGMLPSLAPRIFFLISSPSRDAVNTMSTHSLGASLANACVQLGNAYKANCRWIGDCCDRFHSDSQRPARESLTRTRPESSHLNQICSNLRGGVQIQSDSVPPNPTPSHAGPGANLKQTDAVSLKLGQVRTFSHRSARLLRSGFRIAVGQVSPKLGQVSELQLDPFGVQSLPLGITHSQFQNKRAKWITLLCFAPPSNQTLEVPLHNIIFPLTQSDPLKLIFVQSLCRLAQTV